MIKLIYFAILLCMLSFHTVAQPTVAQKVRAAAEKFVQDNITPKKNQRISVEAVNIDPRTNFEQCQNFSYYLPAGEVKPTTTVRVTCRESAKFRLYIPVRVTWLIPVVTMKRAADQGTTLDQNTLKMGYVDKNKIYGGHYTQINQLIGAKLKKRAQRDEIVNRHDVCMVCRGDSVTIIAKGKGIYLSTTGTALSDGRIRDTIRVKNTQSQRIIRATVTDVGKVSVEM
ncbi:flagellar basal body P-ring formation chaperone FlgA [Celerinatantimonas sp. YJH-8]|uniref:flagellar basal body P-ring formation chaperone FlgA n=1 Tax=Celerinatantimonas sp. YJH-8 TaxID=3228714 RepID=UPI0038CA6649